MPLPLATAGILAALVLLPAAFSRVSDCRRADQAARQAGPGPV